MHKQAALPAILLVLSGCVSTPAATSDPRTTRPLTTTVRGEVPPGGGFRPPSLQRLEGVSGLIGANERQLVQAFGEPRINLTEGDARKLQFASETCVLDVFLYPLEPGQTPIATHAEARNPRGGANIEPASCVAQLNRRPR